MLWWTGSKHLCLVHQPAFLRISPRLGWVLFCGRIGGRVWMSPSLGWVICGVRFKYYFPAESNLLFSMEWTSTSTICWAVQNCMFRSTTSLLLACSIRRVSSTSIIPGSTLLGRSCSGGSSKPFTCQVYNTKPRMLLLSVH